MKLKQTIAILLAITFIITMLTACSAPSKPANGENEEPTVEAQVSLEDEIVTFKVTDHDGNELELVPLYDKDNITIIGGYIIASKDAEGNLLDSTAYPLLYSFVKAKAAEDGSFTLEYDEAGAIIAYEVYSDSEGNIIAIKDTADMDADGDTNEYLAISTLKDTNGVTFYALTADEAGNGYKTVEVTVDDDGIVTATKEDGTKASVSKVNAKNDAALCAITSTVQSSSAATGTTPPPVTPPAGGSGSSPSTPNNGNTPSGSGNNEPDEPVVTDDIIRITLDKNSGATIVNDKQNQASISKGVLTVKGSGNFVIDQSTDAWHGQIVVKLSSTDETEIRLENVNISTTESTAIYIDNTEMNVNNSDIQEVEGSMPEGLTQDQIKQLSKDYTGTSPDLSLAFPTGTKSTISASGAAVTGVIYNEAKLTLKGNGECNLEHRNNSNCTINSVKSIKIKNVSLNINTPVNIEGSRGIYSISDVTVESGNLNISSGGDCIRCDDYEQTGGKVELTSAKADGIDASDSIIVSGGELTAIAVTKSSLKVRAINLWEDGLKELKSTETFEINGGTVTGIGYKVSSVASKSTQASITAQTDLTDSFIYTIYYKEPDDSNTIVREIPAAGRRILYSSSSIDSSKAGVPFSGGGYVECYKVKVTYKGASFNKRVAFNGNIGNAKISLA